VYFAAFIEAFQSFAHIRFLFAYWFLWRVQVAENRFETDRKELALAGLGDGRG
jgi:hypothetical protein